MLISVTWLLRQQEGICLTTSSTEQTPREDNIRSCGQEILAFYETKHSLPRLPEPATNPYPEPDKSSPNPQNPHLTFVLMLSSDFHLGIPTGLFPSGVPIKNLCRSYFYHSYKKLCVMSSILRQEPENYMPEY
jgi:hypothetical protein